MRSARAYCQLHVFPLRKLIALRDNVHVAINPAREPQALNGTDLDGHGLGLRNGEDGRVVHDLRHGRRRRRHFRSSLIGVGVKVD